MQPLLARNKACIIMGALVTLAACDPVVRVRGRVHDPGGKPLANVTVTLQAEGRAAHRSVTGSDGTFAVSIVGADPQHTRLLFERPGYKPLERPLGKDYSSAVEATLQPNSL